MASWRYWLIDVPATVTDIWWRFWLIVVTLLTMACFVSVTLNLVLWFGFGIRWGW